MIRSESWKASEDSVLIETVCSKSRVGYLMP